MKGLRLAGAASRRGNPMRGSMADRHVTRRVDADLEHLSSRFVELRGLIKAQLADAMEVLNRFDPDLVEKALNNEEHQQARACRRRKLRNRKADVPNRE